MLQSCDGVAHFLHQALRFILQAYRSNGAGLHCHHQLRLTAELFQLLLGQVTVLVVSAFGAVDDATATEAISFGLDQHAHD
ncbi:hypothetical protein D3C76_1722320 [compost metagenome]